MDFFSSNISMRVDSIWNKNYPDANEFLSNDYFSLDKAISLYRNLFLKLHNLYSIMDAKKKEQENGPVIEYSKIDKINNDMEILKNLIIVFPIRFNSNDVLFSERIYQCENWPSLYFHSGHENAFETYKEILSNCCVIDEDLTEVFSFDTSSENDYDVLLGRNFFKCKVKKASLPSYLFNDNLFVDLNAFERDYSYIADEFDTLYEMNNMYIRAYERIQFVKNVLPMLKNSEEARNKRKEKMDKIKSEIADLMKSLDELIEEDNAKYKKYFVSEDMLLEDRKEYKTINYNFIKYLKYIDLSNIDFTNVDVRGIDFSDTNPILLNPQIVFNKDLSNTVFISDQTRLNNVFPFGALTNFDEVNLSGASITSDSPIMLDIKKAIIDENTIIELNNNTKKR